MVNVYDCIYVNLLIYILICIYCVYLNYNSIKNIKDDLIRGSLDFWCDVIILFSLFIKIYC